MSKNIAFISGVNLGISALRGLRDSGVFNGDCNLAGVIGLAQKRQANTVGYSLFDKIASELDAPCFAVSSIKTQTSYNLLKKLEPELLFLVGWSELAPTTILDLPSVIGGHESRHGPGYGCVGIHPTLLPLGRGRAPIPWTLIKGLKESGVTMFYLEEEADSGDIIHQAKFSVSSNDDAGSLYRKVADLHYRMFVKEAPKLIDGTNGRYSQKSSQATYWPRRRPEDGAIDWSSTQKSLVSWIRALTKPYPGAFSYLGDRKVTIYRARTAGELPKGCEPGQVLSVSNEGLIVACRNGILILEEVEVEGIEYRQTTQWLDELFSRGEKYFHSSH